MKIISALGVFFLAGSLAFGAGPKILTQPKALTINAGSTATFAVVATNAIGYQWQYKTNNLASETNASLLMENVSTNQAGNYRVLVTGSGGTTTSSAVKLTVVQGTLVQFTIGGTNVVVELFDNDKPATVQNFLHYTKAGIYTNTFFHRLVPGFVLQGGGYGTTNRSVSFNGDDLVNLYSYSYDALSGLLAPAVVNEFSRGPIVRNTYGTLAMAKFPSSDFSSSAQWFFNLVDNSSGLDTNYGGFTVFGRVISGHEVLDYFNNSPSGISITNLGASWTNWADILTDVPVRNDSATLNNADLIYANIKLLTKTSWDTTAPKITMKYPAVNAFLTNSTLTMTGTASDSGAISYIDCYLTNYKSNSGNIFQVDMDVSANWVAVASDLEPGGYLASFRIWDAFGNYNAYNSPFSVGAKMTVQTNGFGQIQNNQNGKFLQITSISPYVKAGSYSMTAVPSKGNLFIGWTGLGSNVSTAKVTFKMFTNLVLTANFVTNRFPAVVGTYNGLFCRTNDGTNLVSPESAGFFTMQTTSAGGYSGNILVAGNKVTLSGTFDYTGHATNSVKLAGYAAPFTLNLYLDLTNNTGEVYGSLSNATWNTSVLGYRGVSSLGTNTTPAAGKYTLTVPGAGAYTNSGTATIVVAKTGSITLSGKLADQSALSQTVVVSKDGWWPIYGSYTKGSGLLWGWVKSEQKTTTGVLRWIKPSTSGNSAIAADVGVTGR